jgi:archaeal type IV pilus assembly protein PilA
MDGMKSNRKFKQEDEAVSAVIGVILMVAITVAIAATVYVYVSGMIGGGQESTPNIACTPDNTNDLLRVVSAQADADWSDINVTITGGGVTTTDTSNEGRVTAGDTIDLKTPLETNQTVNVTFRYDPTNSLIGTWKVS